MKDEKEKIVVSGDATNNFISNAFNKWGDKVWFQVLFIIIVIYLLAGPFINTVLNNHYQKETTSSAVIETLDEREKSATEKHKTDFEQSKQSYALIKKTMREYLPTTCGDYLLMAEYHNGSENVMTGIQFCRFDITLEVSGDDIPYIPLEKFKDDIVARYDILLSDELNKNKLLYYKKNDFIKVDKYLATQLGVINANSYAIINLVDNNNKVFGSLLCISLNEEINTTEVMLCAREIENIVKLNRTSK